MAPKSSTTIVRIDGHEVVAKLPERYGNSHTFFDSRGSLLVSVTTANGVVGWGETFGFPPASGALIQSTFGRMIIGQDAAKPRALHNMMLKRLATDRHGISHMAISALDMATWDAAARTAGIPLHAALGGASRERILAYASGPFMKPGGDPYRDFAADVESYLKAGFQAIKLRIGTKPPNDDAMVRRVRTQIGSDVMLMADLNQGFSYRNALDLACRLAESDVLWLEEPVIYSELSAYRRLAEKMRIALAGGESLPGVAGFREFMRGDIFDLIQPDLAICGGFTEGLKLAALADTFDVPLVPHVWGTVVNFYAALHFAATLPDRRGYRWPCPIFEYDYSFNPLRTLCGEIPLDSGGHVVVPDAPGLGIDLNPAKFDSLIVNHWTLQ
jgi:D-galactarolactone cycloisomerase